MAGLIRLRRSDDRLSFAAPPLLRTGPLSTEKLDEIAGVIGAPRSAIVDAAWCDNGPGWAAVLLASAEDVLALEPARSHPTRLEIGVVGPCPSGSGEAFEIRAFFSDQHGVLREDPVTGSLNAAVAQWLVGSGRATPPYVTRQGMCLGRDGRVHISGNSQQLWVGGVTTTRVEGELFASD
jgi:predicted PhzF superfamily epimerase YddE/YHI9